MAARSPKEARPPPTKGATERCVVTMAARSPKKRDTSTERQHRDDGCALAEEAPRRNDRRQDRHGRAVMMAARSPKKRDPRTEGGSVKLDYVTMAARSPKKRDLSPTTATKRPR